MRGAIATLLGLTLLQAALSGTTDASRLGQLGSAIAKGINWITDPDVALVPDFRPGHVRNASPTLYSTTADPSASSTSTTTVSASTPVAAPTPAPAKTYTA
jgi:hypothetical protein